MQTILKDLKLKNLSKIIWWEIEPQTEQSLRKQKNKPKQIANSQQFGIFAFVCVLDNLTSSFIFILSLF